MLGLIAIDEVENPDDDERSNHYQSTSDHSGFSSLSVRLGQISQVIIKIATRIITSANLIFKDVFQIRFGQKEDAGRMDV